MTTENQLQLENIPKKRGRPLTGKAMSNAERSKKSRDKRKKNDVDNVNQRLDRVTTVHYRLLSSMGLSIGDIITIANAAVLDNQEGRLNTNSVCHDMVNSIIG